MTPQSCIVNTSPYWLKRVPTNNAHWQCSRLLVVYFPNDSRRRSRSEATHVRLRPVCPLTQSSDHSLYMTPLIPRYDISSHPENTGTRPNTLPPLVFICSWRSSHISFVPMVSPNIIFNPNHASLKSTSTTGSTKHVNSHMLTQPTDHSPYHAASYG